jgi:hypothetical protein
MVGLSGCWLLHHRIIESSVSVCVLCTVLHRIDESVVVLEECSLHLCDVHSEHKEGDVDYASSEADGANDAESVEGNVLEIERKSSPSHDHGLPSGKNGASQGLV